MASSESDQILLLLMLLNECVGKRVHAKLVDGDVLINLNRISMRLDAARIIWPKFWRRVPLPSTLRQWVQKEIIPNAMKIKCGCLGASTQIPYTFLLHFGVGNEPTLANHWNCFFGMNEWHRLKYWCRRFHRFFMHIILIDITKNMLKLMYCDYIPSQ